MTATTSGDEDKAFTVWWEKFGCQYDSPLELARKAFQAGRTCEAGERAAKPLPIRYAGSCSVQYVRENYNDSIEDVDRFNERKGGGYW